MPNPAKPAWREKELAYKQIYYPATNPTTWCTPQVHLPLHRKPQEKWILPRRNNEKFLKFLIQNVPWHIIHVLVTCLLSAKQTTKKQNHLVSNTKNNNQAATVSLFNTLLQLQPEHTLAAYTVESIFPDTHTTTCATNFSAFNIAVLLAFWKSGKIGESHGFRFFSGIQWNIIEFINYSSNIMDF